MPESLIGNYVEYANNNPFMAYNHIEITEASPEHSTVKVELQPESMNLHGAVHGGLLYAMADCVAGVTARSDGNDYVTQSTHVNFLRNIREGTVWCSADIIKRGRRVAVLHVFAYDSYGKTLMDGSIDMIRT